jgi:general secretion pathway protein G
MSHTLFGSFCVIVVGLFAGRTGDRMDAANVYCHIQVGRLAQALERYRADCGRYPDARAGLRSLVEDDTVTGWRGPYVKEVPRDPWERPFLYLHSWDSSEPENRVVWRRRQAGRRIGRRRRIKPPP